MLVRNKDGSYTIFSTYGVVNFPNKQKLFKFRLQCRHPSKVETTTSLETKILCGRCGTLFGKIAKTEPQVCQLARRGLGARMGSHFRNAPGEQKQLDDLLNEGGISY